MKIVLINGYPLAGKDTFVQTCQRSHSKGKIWNISTVDLIKEAAIILGWDGKKTERSRKFLSDLKDLATEFSDLSASYIREVKEKAEKEKNVDVIFIHCREPEEIGKLAKEFGAITLLIKNKRVKPVESNHADKYVESYPYDFTIENDEGLLELTRKAVDFLSTLEALS